MERSQGRKDQVREGSMKVDIVRVALWGVLFWVGLGVGVVTDEEVEGDDGVL